jgi:hypothetical protein
MTNDEFVTNDQCFSERLRLGHSFFVIHSSFVIRHSSFA